MNGEKKWASVATDIGYNPLNSAKIGALLKSHYERILYPLDVFEKEEASKVREDKEMKAKVTMFFLQCCESGIPFIPDPDFYSSWIPNLGSRIPDPKTAIKDGGEKQLVVIPFFVAINFTKLKIIFFEMRKEKN